MRHVVRRASDVLSRLDNIADTDVNPQNADKFAVYTYPGAGTIIHAAHPAVSGGLTLTYGSNGDCAGRDRFGRVIDQRRTNAAASGKQE